MSDHEEEEKKLPQSKRIFINHVDSFHGRNLVEYLSQCVVGASLEDLEEEEEEEEEIEEDVDRHKKQKEKEGVYQIVGTMKDHSKPPPNCVKEIIQNNSREILYGQIVDCDIVIYDITEDEDQIDEAVWAVSQLHSDIDKFDDDKHRMFILLSTVMTWARSQPIDPEDVEIPFTEDDYRRRKPHPNFKDHISAEKTIIKLGKTSKSRLVTYVVAVGLTYGAGENIFHYLFKDGWHNNPELSCYGDGRNIVPTIHVRDLAAVIQNVADSRPKCRYIVAVDDSKNTLREIVKSVSKILTTGKVKKIPKEEVLLNKEIQQRDFDMLLVNLRMDSVFIKENMNIKWVSESGIVENIESITREYKETRKLQPIRVFLTGPPASGKTTVVEQLCKHFKLHHITIKDVITESITKMEKFIADYEAAQRKKEEEKPEEEEEDEEDEDDSEDGKLDTYRELLESIRESREQNHGRIDDQLIIQLYHEKLLSKPCQNQGFILDGFPKLIDQAKELFDAGEEESEKEEGKVHYNRNLMPHLIVCLQATDNFLHERIINLPESVIVGTHNTEDGFSRRLAEYRAVNTEDETVLNYFDELEFHPEMIDIVEDSSLKMKETVEKIIKLMPQPRNYGPTPVEKEETMRIETEKKLKKEEKEKEEKEKQEAEERELRAQRQCEWANRLEQVRNEEKELLEAKSVPLRNYLMKHVMPTLTKGLMECCKVRPDDAVDYLAEYMFKNNPQVD